MNEQRRQELFREFANLGEAEVRHRVTEETWKSHDPSKHRTAKLWLEHRAEEREEDKADLARKAHNAARCANIIAAAALIVAALAYFKS